MIGQTVSHYKIVEKIGGGGMGVVYKAEDTRLKRTVALKFLPSDLIRDEDAKTRFVHEAQAASALQHPNICTIHDVEQTDDHRLFIVMDCYEGESVKSRIANGQIRIDEALDIAAQVARGLAKAHESGIVHRDIKPANIMLGKDGIVRIVDFGLAKLSGQTMLTKSGSMVGTAAYMSPEQARGEKVDYRTDIWSLGVVLYEMLTSQQPFASEYEQAMMYSILSAEPKPIEELRPEVPGNIIGIVQRAMEKDKGKRFQSAAEMAEALRGEGKPLKKKMSGRKRRMVWYAAAAVVVIAAALGIFLTMTGAEVIDSIAVLPPRDLSNTAEDEALSYGVHDGLITELNKIGALTTKARQSVIRYKKTDLSPAEISKELGGVKAFVEPSFQQLGERVRIKARLIRASSGDVLNMYEVEGDSKDILSLYSEVAQKIIREIRIAMTPQERKRLTTTSGVDPEVYTTTLKGKLTLEHATSEDQFRRAIALCQKAIDRDPMYAPAWAGLGEALWCLAATGFEFVAPSEVRTKAIAAANRALELDENLPDAHKARAMIAIDGEWDLANAQRHFERALELQPGYASAHNMYGQILGGQPLQCFEESRRHLDRARELDPLSPWNDLNLVAWWLYQGRAQEAIEEAERAIIRNPTQSFLNVQLKMAYLVLGQSGKVVSDSGQGALSGLAFGLVGRKSDALRILTEMKKRSEKHYVAPYSLAVVCSGLGQMDEAFRHLDRAIEERTPYLAIGCSRYDPLFVALRRDARWKGFIDKLRQLVKLPAGTPDPYL
jgi:eukaryotic-like serine/threonine-protein kinase